MEALVVIIVLCNTLACLLQFGLQQADKNKPARWSEINGSNGQYFLYWQDFKTQTYGDFLFLPLVAIGFYSKQIGDWEWMAFVFITLVAAALFAGTCMGKNHKPDWGYPRIGEISMGGVAHLFYLGMYVAMSVICLFRICIGELTGWPLILTLIGGAGWIATFIWDYRLGHFEPFKPEEKI